MMKIILLCLTLSLFVDFTPVKSQLNQLGQDLMASNKVFAWSNSSFDPGDNPIDFSKYYQVRDSGGTDSCHHVRGSGCTITNN